MPWASRTHQQTIRALSPRVRGSRRDRGPREQPRIHTEFVAQSGPVWGLSAPSGTPQGAPRWALGKRTPPGRTDLRPGRPVGPGAVSGRLGANGRGVVAPPVAREAAWMHDGTDLPVRCTQAGRKHGGHT